MIDRKQTANTRKMMDKTPKIDENCKLLISLSKESGNIIPTHEINMSTHRVASKLPAPKYNSPNGVIISPNVTRYATAIPKQKIRILISTNKASFLPKQNTAKSSYDFSLMNELEAKSKL